MSSIWALWLLAGFIPVVPLEILPQQAFKTPRDLGELMLGLPFECGEPRQNL